MIVTPELMRACGSGADPNDALCMRGYNAFVSEYEKHDFSVSITHSLAYARAQKAIISLVADNLITKEQGLLFKRWFYKLKTNPIAIRLGGYCEETGIYKFKELEYVSLEEAESVKSNIKSQIENSPFEYVNVLRQIKNNSSLITAPVSCLEQITEKELVTVFNSDTGRHEVVSDVKNAVQVELQKVISKVDGQPIYTKLKDTMEGFEAWEAIR